ncbi:hypothetical protein ACJX0J_033488, partial [Zea mays]
MGTATQFEQAIVETTGDRGTEGQGDANFALVCTQDWLRREYRGIDYYRKSGWFLFFNLLLTIVVVAVATHLMAQEMLAELTGLMLPNFGHTIFLLYFTITHIHTFQLYSFISNQKQRFKNLIVNKIGEFIIIFEIFKYNYSVTYLFAHIALEGAKEVALSKQLFSATSIFDDEPILILLQASALYQTWTSLRIIWLGGLNYRIALRIIALGLPTYIMRNFTASVFSFFMVYKWVAMFSVYKMYEACTIFYSVVDNRDKIKTKNNFYLCYYFVVFHFGHGFFSLLHSKNICPIAQK